MGGEFLGVVAEIVMGQSPPGDTVSEMGGLPLLNGPTEFGTHHPIPVQFTSDPRKKALTGDLLFCVRGSTTGRMNWADQVYAIGRGVAAIRHKDGMGLQPFVRAVIEFELPELLAQATGSTFPNVSASQLAAIPIPCLERTEQRAIAHILGTLDDKIELNRRINETLEAMARAIFKSWFVDFDPVRAKMEGRDTGLPPHIADLFPDHLVPSEQGEIPQGWDTYNLDELADHHTKTLAPSSFPEHGFEHYSIPAFDSGSVPAIEPGCEIKSNKTVIPHNAVLLSKLNPDIPRVWIPESRDEFVQICSTEFLVFTPEDLGTRSLLYALFTDEAFRGMLRSMVTGTSGSHQRVPAKALRNIKVLTGTRDIFLAYEGLANPMLGFGIGKRKESRTLANLRDALLPTLMSGDLRVNDAESFLEQAL